MLTYGGLGTRNPKCIHESFPHTQLTSRGAADGKKRRQHLSDSWLHTPPVRDQRLGIRRFFQVINIGIEYLE